VAARRLGEKAVVVREAVVVTERRRGIHVCCRPDRLQHYCYYLTSEKTAVAATLVMASCA
jgi:hypothetical protein